MTDTAKFTDLDAERFTKLAKGHLLALYDIDLYQILVDVDINISYPTPSTATATFDYVVPDPKSDHRGSFLLDDSNPGHVVTESRTIDIDPQDAYSYEVDLIRIQQLTEPG